MCNGIGFEPIAEELGQELQIRRLPAARAGARVLEQRLEELRALEVGLDPGPVGVPRGTPDL